MRLWPFQIGDEYRRWHLATSNLTTTTKHKCIFLMHPYTKRFIAFQNGAADFISCYFLLCFKFVSSFKPCSSV
eukprot:g61773.t1